MIISQTPLRCSLLGGGSDYPDWYLEHGGAVITTTINKYCRIYYDDGIVGKKFELPTGAGMGTSSAWTVGLMRIHNPNRTPKETARFATDFERDKLGGNIGVQDQYICSLGGFRLLRFSVAGVWDYEFKDIDWLNQYLMLFNTNQYRQAGKVVSNQLNEMKRHTKLYERIVAIVDEGKIALEHQDYREFGGLLNESWHIKRQLSKYISNIDIDGIYDRAKELGAIGGKLLGAGGGGFMLFLAPLDKQESIKNALVNCEYIPFEFEKKGSQIIFQNEKADNIHSG